MRGPRKLQQLELLFRGMSFYVPPVYFLIPPRTVRGVLRETDLVDMMENLVEELVSGNNKDDAGPLSMSSTLYLYFDEGGNFDFSPTGSTYFSMTCVAMRRPFNTHPSLLHIKYDCLERGLSIERFHATEDKQIVRDRVFEAIRADLASFHVYTVLIRKNKTNPTMRSDREVYTRVFDWLVKYVCPRQVRETDEVVAVTDALPLSRKQDAVRAAVKRNLKLHLPSGVSYSLYHLQSKCDLNLQIADYFNWAVLRKWELGDERSYALIRRAIRGERDLFAGGTTVYY